MSGTANTRETKALGITDSQQPHQAIQELNQSFLAFKEANDERLSAIERKADASETSKKLARLVHHIDCQDAKLRAFEAKQAFGTTSHNTVPKTGHQHTEHKAFSRYLRRGESTSSMSASTNNTRSSSGNTGSLSGAGDGGVLLPGHTATEIGRRMAGLSPLRNLATVIEVSVPIFKKPYCVDGPVTGWVGETAVRPETDAPNIEALSFPTMELYAMPAATASLLDDSAIDISSWLIEEVEKAFAEQESEAFINGNGTDRPKGILAYPVVNNSSAGWGQLGTLKTGHDGDFHPDNPADSLIDLIYALKAGYRQNGRFLMNHHTQAEVRKLKDSEGRYLWQPAERPGETPTLLGYPIVEADHMPSIGAGAHAIAFGDFSRGYLVVDRQGVAVLRDPFSAKPYVLFYTTKRVGGGVQDFDAIKLLTFSA